MSSSVHRLPTPPNANQAVLRRQLLAESTEMALETARKLQELQDRLDGSDDVVRLDFTRLSAIRVQAASLATTTGKLHRRPFARPFRRT